MKAIGAWLLVQLLLPNVVSAQQNGIDTLFPAKPAGYVTDVAGILDPAVTARVEDRLKHLHDVTGAEVAVVTLPSIGDYAPVDVAVRIGRSWGVGANAPIGDQRRNAGVVVLLVPRTKDHGGHVQIAPGTGSEGFITDARSGEIADSMLPDLRNGDYSGAVDLGTSILADVISRNLGVQDSSLTRPQHTGGGSIPPGIVFLLIILFFVVMGVISRGGRGRGGRGGGGGGWIVPFLIGQALGGGFGGRGGGGFGGGFGGGGGGFGGFGGGGGFSGGGAGRGF